MFQQLSEIWSDSSDLAMVTALLEGANCAEITDAIECLEFQVILNPEARLDTVRCEDAARKCCIQSSLQDTQLWSGFLVRSGADWLIHRDGGDDDPAWFFDGDCIRPGELVTVRDYRGTKCFRIICVRHHGDMDRSLGAVTDGRSNNG